MEFVSEQKDCDCLAGLFQQTVGNMKGSYPAWEDFMNKATKLHIAIRTVAVSTSAFLDAFQKVADLANSSRGVTREMGAALTRLCIRQRSVEGKMKAFASAIMESLVEPLQGKMDDWKRSSVQLDKDHGRDYKKTQQDIKKAMQDTARLCKRAAKGGADVQTKYEQATRDVHDKFVQLELTQKTSVRQALSEEQSRFCYFINSLKPVMDAEINILTEITHVQDIVDILSGQASDANLLSQSIEQVIIDLKNKETNIAYKTPPSSPTTLISRKSSVCSVSGSSSSGSVVELQPQSPCYQSVTDDKVCQLRQPSSISSQDSGFASQEVTSDVPRENSCWNGTLEGLKHFDHSFPACDSTHPCRPHTVSSAYERSTLTRPSITSHTFVDPNNAGAEKVGAIYATPNSSAARMADIQSRLSLIYGRRHNVTPQLPSATAQYSTLGGATVASRSGVKNKQMPPLFHRSCSLPPPMFDVVSETGTLLPVELRQKYLLVTDDNNYISSTPYDFTPHASHDLESMMNGQQKDYTLDDSRKFMTLPRNCQPFKIPQLPTRSSALTGSGKAKPLPPARRNSMKSDMTSSSSGLKLSDKIILPVVEDDVFQNGVTIHSVADVPRQQDPPADDVSDILWLPSPSLSHVTESIDSGVLEWPSEELADISRTVEPSCTMTSPDDVDQLSSAVKTMTSTDDVDDVDEPTDVTCTLELIRQGVRLRKTESRDRSAPVLG